MRVTTVIAALTALLAVQTQRAAAQRGSAADVTVSDVPGAAAAEAPGPPLAYASPDGSFSVSLGARLQARYTFLDADQADGPGQDVSEWRIRRAKLSLSGWAYSPSLTFRLQAAFENAGTPHLLDDVYLNWRLRDEIEIRGGQFKTPFAREELYSAGTLELVERANAVDTFKASRDIGVMLHGGALARRLTYQVGVFGGAGQSTARTSADNMIAARLVAEPLGQMTSGEGDLARVPRPLLSLGADVFKNALRKTGPKSLESSTPNYASATGWLGPELGLFGPTEKIAIESWSLDMAFKWRGFSLQSEYLRGRAEGRETGTVLRARGGYLQAGYLLPPGRLGLAARYSSIGPNLGASQDRQNEAQGAVSWYFRKHKLKLQADYTNIHRGHGAQPATDDHQLRLQSQLEF